MPFSNNDYFWMTFSSLIPDFLFVVERAKEDSFMFKFKCYTLIPTLNIKHIIFCDADTSF